MFYIIPNLADLAIDNFARVFDSVELTAPALEDRDRFRARPKKPLVDRAEWRLSGSFECTYLGISIEG